VDASDEEDSMPRVIVMPDSVELGDAPVLLDELVNSVHISTDHAARQLVERLAWAIGDAEDVERVDGGPRSGSRSLGITARRV
jgi:hypothetical protein